MLTDDELRYFVIMAGRGIAASLPSGARFIVWVCTPDGGADGRSAAKFVTNLEHEALLTALSEMRAEVASEPS